MRRRIVGELDRSGKLAPFRLIHVELGTSLSDEFHWAYQIARTRPGLPIVLTVHDPPYTVRNLCPYYDFGSTSGFRDRWVRKVWNVSAGHLIERDMLHRAAAVTTLSRRGATLLSRRFDVRVTTIPHIASILPELPPQPRPLSSPLRVLFFGYLSRDKGLHVLLEAVRLLARDRWARRFMLTIVGKPFGEPDSATLPSLRSAMNEPLVRSHLVVTGFLPDDELSTLLTQHDVLVLPYVDDRICSSSGPLVTGLQFGLVPVVTRTRALAEVVVDSGSGFVAEPRSPQGLASALGRLIDSPDRVQLDRARALAYAQKSSPRAVARALSDIYSVVGGLQRSTAPEDDRGAGPQFADRAMK